MPLKSFTTKTALIAVKQATSIKKPVAQPKATTSFSGFRIVDAAADASVKEVFENGALKIHYNNLDLTNRSRQAQSIQMGREGSARASFGSAVEANVKAINNASGEIVDLGTTRLDLNSSSFLVNLKDKINVFDPANKRQDWTIDVSMNSTSRLKPSVQVEHFSESITMIDPLQGTASTSGDGVANQLVYQNIGSTQGSGRIYIGRGGTDTLLMEGLNSNQVQSLNGKQQLAGTMESVEQQALYGGTAFDVLNLTNGDELYLQGIERIQFTDRTISLNQEVSESSKQQWNLQAMDVHGAWRFNKGSSNVALVSLDTGLGDIEGNESDRHSELWNMVYRTNKNDIGTSNIGARDHGHRAMSVMGAKHDGLNLAGLSPMSPIYGYNIYGGGVSLFEAINDAKNKRNNNQKLVFQGGIQGGSWWTDGASREAMQTALDETAEYGFFAIAAGNGGPGGGFNSEVDYLTGVSGVAQAESTNGNIASVGALQYNGTESIDGLINPTGYQIAGYSNRGRNLTLMGTTDTTTINADGLIGGFGGTSAANPNVAAVAALVWSENTNLTGSQLRDILTNSAMDLGDAGRDTTFGFGLVNAEAGVRRAYALHANPQLANFWSTQDFIA